MENEEQIESTSEEVATIATPTEEQSETTSDTPSTVQGDGELQIPEPAQVDALPQITADTLAAEWVENEGKLSESTVSRLSDAGIDPSLVDMFVAGQEALAESANNKLYEVTGGKEATHALLQWASTALDASLIQSINSQLSGRDINSRVLAMRGLQSMYREMSGSTPLVSGSTGKPLAPFQSDQELVAAMRDKRYSTDPAYRKEVTARIAGMR